MKFFHSLPPAAFFLALPCLLLSCAKVGEPLPPPVRVPPTPASVVLIQEGGRFVHLAFSSPLDDIAEIELYRACSGEEFRDPLVTVTPEQATLLPDGSLRVTDDRPQDPPCRYALRLVDVQKDRSGWSEIVQTSMEIAPLPPTGLNAEVRADEIFLQWDAPERNVEGDPIPSPVAYLINSDVLVKETHYRDTQFQFGRTSRYSVQAVGRLQDPVILSEPGETLTLIPRDIFPPPAPENVNAVLVGSDVQLVWDVVESGDVRGYVVYGGTDRTKLNRVSPVVTTNRYLDQNVPPGGPLFYRVATIDHDGNESEPSEVVSVRTDN